MTFERRNPTRWPEHDLIEKEYPRRGRHWIAEKIDKHPATVHAYARRHGLELGDIPGWIRVSEVAHALGVQPHIVHQRATYDGVLRRLRTKGAEMAFAAIVPIKWADAFVEERTTRQANTERAKREGWYSINDLVPYWGVGRGTILRALNGEGALAPYLHDAETMRGHGQAPTGVWWVHPESARIIRDRLNVERDKARRMVSTKLISVEEGVGQGYAATLGRKLGGELLFVNGRLMCHVTPQVAQRMRARFRRSKAGAHKRAPRVNTPPKQCVVCGATFERRHADPYESPHNYKKRETCSQPCAGKLRWANRRATP